MFHFPKRDTIALDMHHAFAYRRPADDAEPGRLEFVFRHAAIHALSIGGMMVFLVILLIL